MEEKKTVKISLSTFFLILAIIIIVIMAIFTYKFYNEKIEANEQSNKLQTQVNNLNGIVSDLQKKIDTISSTINSNDSNKNNNDDKSDNNSLVKPTSEDTIKDLFLAKLKALNNSNSEKLLDYRVDKVEIERNSKDQSFTDLGYKPDDILAYVTYSVKPKNINTSVWIAGNGEVEGEWIINKIACECLRNGKLVRTGLTTGW